MNRQVAGLALIVAAAGFCVAQNPAAIAGHLPFHSELSAIVQSEPQSSASAQNATVIRIVLSKSLDAKKLKEGDPVEAKTETELSANGLVAPRGSVIKGHVTQASARSKGGQESSLGIAFDAIVLKNGQPMPLKTSIQAVGAPPNLGPGTMDGEPVAPVTSSPGAPGSPSVASPPMPGQAGGFPQPPSSLPQDTGGQQSAPSSATLNEKSTGVVGLRNMQLQSASTLTSSGKDLKLDAGTEMILQVQSQ